MYIPDSVMVFVVEDSKLKNAIPEVVSPAYVYKVGDMIEYSDVLDDGVRYTFSVTKVVHEISQSFINTDQTIVIHLAHLE